MLQPQFSALALTEVNIVDIYKIEDIVNIVDIYKIEDIVNIVDIYKIEDIVISTI